MVRGIEDRVNKLEKIRSKKALIGIIGLGYVGLPLSYTFWKSNIRVLGFDIDSVQIGMLERGKSYINHIPDESIRLMRDQGMFDGILDFSRVSEVDVIIICVPTPLTRQREPDLTAIINTAHSITPYLQKGQLVVLESSSYPGTTDKELANLLEKSGLKKDKDFFIAYSPEREDPGNESFSTSTIPKIVGADSPRAKEMVTALYESIISEVVHVSSSRTAEAVKLTENIFRSVNIALVNELKIIFDAMDIDIWEVIDGAATKPFGFMPFYPGPGLGGHCIPIDPFYLTYKAREFDVPTRFIELAGEINTYMPIYVVNKLILALSDHSKQSVNGARILIVGMAYKKNVDDTRGSSSLVLTSILENRGAIVEYHDNLVPIIPNTRDYPSLCGRRSVPITKENITKYDVILISTDHADVDYQMLADHAQIIIDTRNVMSDFLGKAKIIKA